MSKIPIYFVPGLAASPKIFKNLRLPKEKFEMHFLEWIIPLSKDEPIEDYAKRMTEKITHKNPVFVGVSFGGIMVQEMSKHIDTKTIILISTIKQTSEMPKHFRFVRKTKLYYLFPALVINKIEYFSKFIFGKTIKKRIELYKVYLSERNRKYLKWAIKNVVCWKQEKPLKNTVHIHGNKDLVFPIKNIKDCQIIDEGTHIMILTKAKKIKDIITNLF